MKNIFLRFRFSIRFFLSLLLPFIKLKFKKRRKKNSFFVLLFLLPDSFFSFASLPPPPYPPYSDDVDYITFVKLIKGKYRQFDEDNELRESFRMFDKEEKGFICIEDLKKMLTTMGEPLSESEMNDWLRDASSYIRKKKLFYEDFATFMLSK